MILSLLSFFLILKKCIYKSIVFYNRCNEKSTTTSEPVTVTTGTVSTAFTESTTTTDELRCEGFYQNTGTRKISTCPGDEFCYTLENKVLLYEIGPDGNATNDIAWNITLGKEDHFVSNKIVRSKKSLTLFSLMD